MMAIVKDTISKEKQHATYAMTKVPLYNTMQKQFAQYDATVVLLDHGRWGVMKDGQLRSTFLVKNSKNWVNDPKATSLVGRFRFRSWTAVYSSDLEADVDFYVMAVTQRHPEMIDMIVLTKDQLQKLWDDPRRKSASNGSKFFYFGQLLTGRLGDARFAKSANKGYEGWIDIDKSLLNNYEMLVDDFKRC